MGAAIDYLSAIGMQKIHEYEVKNRNFLPLSLSFYEIYYLISLKLFAVIKIYD